jgi:hypothetical protein
MKISYYNRYYSKIAGVHDSSCIPLDILIADQVNLCSLSADFMAAYAEIDQISPNSIALSMESSFPEDEETLLFAKEVRETWRTIKMINALKHKSRFDLLYLGKFKSFVSDVRKGMREHCENFLLQYHLYELMPFIEEKVLEVQKLEWDENPKRDSNFIKSIGDCIKNHKDILCLDEIIEDLFAFSILAENNAEAPAFVKLTLWNFPPIVGLNYNQIKYTRNELQSALHPFKEFLKDLSELLFLIPYSSDNFAKMEELCNEKINEIIPAVQKSIGESLYLSQLKNKFPETVYIQLCLGITSAETIISFYEKSGILLPDLAVQLKEQLLRDIDVKVSYPFLYYRLITPNPDDDSITGFSHFLK